MRGALPGGLDLRDCGVVRDEGRASLRLCDHLSRWKWPIRHMGRLEENEPVIVDPCPASSMCNVASEVRPGAAMLQGGGANAAAKPAGAQFMDIQQISVDRIILDDRNPRIAHVVADFKNSTPQEWIPMALGQYAPEDQEGGSASTYSSLKASIRAYRGLIVPIIVTPRPDGDYVVIEGNTRVAIFRELAEEGAPGNWDAIPAIVQSDLPEEGEHAIRLQAHLVGPRPWRPYAKAKYLHDLYINKKMSINEILDFCGGKARKQEIEDYIAA